MLQFTSLSHETEFTILLTYVGLFTEAAPKPRAKAAPKKPAKLVVSESSKYLS
jgi:hypothetical protein